MDELSKVKIEFNELYTLVLPKIKAIKQKQKQGTLLSSVEMLALERYDRVAKLIKEGKASHFL